jgi:hypothetical protein
MSDEITMPWGQFKGKFIHKLPSSYLRWVAENADWDERIQLACDEEYQWRESNGQHIDD